MNKTLISTSEAGLRRVDFSQIIDTIVVVGLFVVVFLGISPHGTTATRFLAAFVWTLAVTTSILLHRATERSREERAFLVYIIAPQTLLTLKAVSVPQDVLDGLQVLIGQPPAIRAAFKRSVQQALGVARAQEWMKTIFLYSEIRQ